MSKRRLIPEHEDQMKAHYEQDKRDFIRTHRNSLPPDRFPWLADVPTRAMSEPADDRDIPDLDPTELQTAIHRFAKSARDKASKASDLRRRAEANLCRVEDLRQQADALAHDADAYQVEAAMCEAAAAEARKDEENAKSFASFLGIDMETGGGSQMMLDRVRSLSAHKCWLSLTHVSSFLLVCRCRTSRSAKMMSRRRRLRRRARTPKRMQQNQNRQRRVHTLAGHGWRGSAR
jgi:hypothetical protein